MKPIPENSITARSAHVHSLLLTERYLKAKYEVEQLGKEILAKYPDCKELLQSYADAIHITSTCEGLQDFERGFSLGALIMLEIMATE